MARTHARTDPFIFVLLLGVFSTMSLAEPPSGDDNLVTVISEGVGRDREEAEKNAITNAVRQAIGVVVSADTMVENDQLIRDRVLTYSNGYVKKIEHVGKPRQTESGLIAVTIKALVRGERLIEKVEAEKISTVSVDGLSLYAEAITKRRQRLNKQGHLGFDLEGLPSSLVKATVDPAELQYDEKTETASVPVNIEVDSTAYESLVSRLRAKMKQLGVKEYKLTSSAHKKDLDDDTLDQVEERYESTGLRWTREMKEEYINRKGYLKAIRISESQLPKEYIENDSEWSQTPALLLCTQMNRSMRSSQWSFYRPDRDMMKEFSSIHNVLITVNLIDDEGGVIDFQRITLGAFDDKLTGTPICFPCSKYGDTYNSQVVVHPIIASRIAIDTGYPDSYYIYYDAGWLKKQHETRFFISPSQVKRIAKIVCSVEAGATAAQ